MGGLGVRGGLGDKETGCRYQQVHKQTFRVYLFRGHGGDLGLGGGLGDKETGCINKYINNHLGFVFLGDMGETGVRGGLGDKEAWKMLVVLR